MGFNITVFGEKELNRRFQELPQKVQRKILKGSLKEGAEMVLEQTQANAPVDTGLTKESFELENIKGRNKVGWKIVSNPEVIPDARVIAQEYGTSKDPAHPFMRPAVETCREAVVQSIEQDVKSAVEGK